MNSWVEDGGPTVPFAWELARALLAQGGQWGRLDDGTICIFLGTGDWIVRFSDCPDILLEAANA